MVSLFSLTGDRCWILYTFSVTTTTNDQMILKISFFGWRSRGYLLIRAHFSASQLYLIKYEGWSKCSHRPNKWTLVCWKWVSCWLQMDPGANPLKLGKLKWTIKCTKENWNFLTNLLRSVTDIWEYIDVLTTILPLFPNTAQKSICCQLLTCKKAWAE